MSEPFITTMLLKIPSRVAHFLTAEKKLEELEKKFAEVEKEKSAQQYRIMNTSMAITDFSSLLQQMNVGDLNVIANENTGDALLDQLGRTANQLLASLTRLARTTMQVAAGDLTVEIKIRSERDLLVSSFAKMVNDLKMLIGTVNQLSVTTEKSSQEMAQKMDMMNQTMQQVQASIEQIASASGNIARSAQGISLLVQNTSASVDAGSTNIMDVIAKFSSV
ncbi:MAG: methyl-accepting chemotaxis protein, partial [Endomicrobiales bacterium]